MDESHPEVTRASVGHLNVVIERLQPRPGDVVVVRGLDPTEATHFLRAMSTEVEWVFSVPVLVLPEGAEVTVETLDRLKEEVEASRQSLTLQADAQSRSE